jgi:hypothetical protein
MFDETAAAYADVENFGFGIFVYYSLTEGVDFVADGSAFVTDVFVEILCVIFGVVDREMTSSFLGDPDEFFFYHITYYGVHL